MNYRSHNANFILMILCALMLGMVSPATAQEAIPVPVVYAENDTGITLYAVSADKTLAAIGNLPDDFTTDAYKTTWKIRKNLVVSPDKQQLAFTAQKYDDNKNRVAFYIFSLTEQTFRQVFEEDYIGYYLHLKWSPDSQNILIEPEVEDNCGCMGRAEVRIYNLVSGDIHQLTDRSRDLVGGSFTWATNNFDLIYSGSGVDIVEIRPDGIHRQSLVNFEMNPPPDSFSGSCNFAWSEQRTRWYYVVGCFWDDPLDSLHSVDLSGDARMEADLPDLLRKEFPLPAEYEPYVEDVHVTNIHQTEAAVYAAFEFKAMAPESSDPGSDWKLQDIWRVIRLGSPGKMETAFEFTASGILNTGLVQAAFAPDNQKVALVAGSLIVIGDLVTGDQLVMLPRTLESYYDRTNVQWIDEARLLYAADSDVWLLDASDGKTFNLTADIESTAYLLPQTNSY
jgi:hypothetical protein